MRFYVTIRENLSIEFEKVSILWNIVSKHKDQWFFLCVTKKSYPFQSNENISQWGNNCFFFKYCPSCTFLKVFERKDVLKDIFRMLQCGDISYIETKPHYLVSYTTIWLHCGYSISKTYLKFRNFSLLRWYIPLSAMIFQLTIC